MDVKLQGTIALLRSALTGEKVAIPEGFFLSEVLDIVRYHRLTPLMVRGAMRCGISRSDPGLQQCMLKMCTDVKVSRFQMQMLEALYQAMDEAGIDYMPVKGAVLKAMYPAPELRSMSDADLLVREEQYPRLIPVLKALGMEKTQEEENVHAWLKEDFLLEVHTRLMPEIDRDFKAYYSEGWDLAIKNGSGTGYHLGNEDHFVFLLVHFAKHYRNGCVSAKNLCDFWVWKKKYPDMDEAYLFAQLEKLGLLKFYGHIEDLLKTWFEGCPATAAVERITEVSFKMEDEKSGNIAQFIKQGQQQQSHSGNKRKWFLQKLFPGMLQMANEYPVLRKWKILLPVMWCVRWVQILFSRERMSRGIHTSQYMQEDVIRSYEQELDMVGLHFNG